MGADLWYANLYGVNLYGANLGGVNGIKAVSCVGDSKRLVFSYVFNDEIRIQAGCRNGTKQEIIDAINKDYADKPILKKEYLAAIEYLTIYFEASLTQE